MITFRVTKPKDPATHTETEYCWHTVLSSSRERLCTQTTWESGSAGEARGVGSVNNHSIRKSPRTNHGRRQTGRAKTKQRSVSCVRCPRGRIGCLQVWSIVGSGHRWAALLLSHPCMWTFITLEDPARPESVLLVICIIGVHTLLCRIFTVTQAGKPRQWHRTESTDS